VTASSHKSDWLRLLRVARSLIHQVNAEQSIIDYWTLGGGTALMLQIGHRDSHDVDIFIPDPQLLPFLDPQKNDLTFEMQPIAYRGDGSKSLKFSFGDIGEIDFIVSGPLTSTPAIARDMRARP
jgi:hypothetical protein